MLATFIIGLSFGAGACMFTCIPTLGVAILSQSLTPREVMAQTWRFNSGRIAAYALMAAVSGAIGASLVGLINVGFANLVLAGMLTISALLLWRTEKRPGCSGAGKRLVMAGMFGMGFGMGLRPCLPLAGVMAAAAATGSWQHGLLLGSVFGVGAVVVPQIVFGYALGRAGAEMRSQMRKNQHLLSRVGATILLVVSVGVGMEWITL